MAALILLESGSIMANSHLRWIDQFWQRKPLMKTEHPTTTPETGDPGAGLDECSGCLSSIRQHLA